MNLDLVSQFNFGDADSLRAFLLDHRAVHEQTATALTLKFKSSFGTGGLDSILAEDQWAALMRERTGATPAGLRDWLQIHAEIHNATYEVLAGPSVQAPDLSVVDFAKPEQFYDWMYAHAQMHDFEQSSLGLI